MKNVIIIMGGGAGLPQLQRRVPRRPDVDVVAFTATQIPGIDQRRYPSAGW